MNSPVKWRRVTVLGASAYESEDGQWRVLNPWQMDTAVGREWIVRERDGDVWVTHDGGYKTMREARAYAEEEGTL